MRDSHSSGQESICILLSAPCKGKLLSILFPDRVENECIHQLSTCRPRPKAELFCSVLAKTSHLTKSWKMGLPVSSSWIRFSMTRLVNWGYTRDTSFAIFSSLSTALISTVSPRWNVFYFSISCNRMALSPWTLCPQYLKGPGYSIFLNVWLPKHTA